VVSISACHSKEQLAGGRGSIPRQRDTFLLHLLFLLQDLCPLARALQILRDEAGICECV
jgi:hypothetical protein